MIEYVNSYKSMDNPGRRIGKFGIKILLSTVVLVFTNGILKAQTWQDTVTVIDKISDRYRSDKPGCQLAISRNGQVIL